MTPVNLQRRRTLRNVVGTAGVLWISAIAAGCKDKAPPAPTTEGVAPDRGGSSSAAGQAAPGGGAPASPPAQVQGPKVTKEQVQYQDHPKGEQTCASCTHFVAQSGTCKLVDGPINPGGWCTLWSQKTS